MKTKLFVNLLGLLAIASVWTGCVVHEHDHVRYRRGYREYHGEYHARHVHGPGCGHVLRGGVWITIP